MQPIQPAPANTFWSYLSSFRVVGFVLSFWKPKESHWGDRNVVVCKDFGQEWVEVGIHSNLAELLNQTSRPYPMEQSGTTAFAKTFFSDISRSGQPDRFVLNGKEIVPPKTVQEILQKLLNIAEGDGDKVAFWTQIWNYRLKSTLYDALVTAFFEEYTMKPVCGRNDYLDVQISLDSEKHILSCSIKGIVKNAIDDNRPYDILNVNTKYKAEFSFDSAMGVADHTIRFFPGDPNGG